MNCPADTVLGSVAIGAALTGATDGSSTATCNWGYTFGGAASIEYTKTFSCVGTGNAVNEWQPATSPDTSKCLGECVGCGVLYD